MIVPTELRSEPTGPTRPSRNRSLRRHCRGYCPVNEIGLHWRWISRESAIMPIKHSWSLLWAVAFFASVGVNAAHAAPLMIVGNDEKLLWDDNSKPIISPAGKDSVLIVDLAEPEN